MTAPQLSKLYGFSDDTMNRIIVATHDAISSMQKINSNVQTLAGTLPTVNKSTSGILLAQRIDDWNRDYNQIVSKLNELNERATNVRKSNVDTSEQTTQASQAHQS